MLEEFVAVLRFPAQGVAESVAVRLEVLDLMGEGRTSQLRLDEVAGLGGSNVVLVGVVAVDIGVFRRGGARRRGDRGWGGVARSVVAFLVRWGRGGGEGLERAETSIIWRYEMVA